MAKTEKPADPLLTVALSTDADMMPALSGSTDPVLGDNSVRAADPLARLTMAVRYIDAQIAVLNSQKSLVYKQAALLGFDKKLAKHAEKELRVSPEQRAEIERKRRAYVLATEQALARMQAEEAAATPEAEEAPAAEVAKAAA